MYILTVWHNSDCISEGSFWVRTFWPIDTNLIVFLNEVFVYVHFDRLTLLWQYFRTKFLGTYILSIWHSSDRISERSFWVCTFSPIDTTLIVFLNEVLGTYILTVWHNSDRIAERSFWVRTFWPFDTTMIIFLKEVLGYVHFDRLTPLW